MNNIDYNILLDRTVRLIDSNQIDDAIKSIENVLHDKGLRKNPEKGKIIFNFAGQLIDAGIEKSDEKLLLKAIQIYSANKDDILICVKDYEYYYNFANAKNGLFEIKYQGQDHLKPGDLKSELKDAIKNYWIAFKSADSDPKVKSGIKHSVLVNLSKSLIKAGRVAESMQFLTLVLKSNSNHLQANVAKADNLEYFLLRAARVQPTISLFISIIDHYQKVIGSDINVPPSVVSRVKEGGLQIIG